MTGISKRRKLELALLVTLSGGTTFQVFAGCAELFGQGGAAALDFCFLLDCQNGFFGGLAQPCDQQGGFTFFIDCPNLTPPFGTPLGPPPAGAQGGGMGAAGGVGGAGAGAGGGNQQFGRGGFGPLTQPPQPGAGNPGAAT